MQITIPLEDQPDEGDWFDTEASHAPTAFLLHTVGDRYGDGSHMRVVLPPHAPGDTVPVREEWTICDTGDDDQGRPMVLIAYRPNEANECNGEKEWRLLENNLDGWSKQAGMKQLLQYLEVYGDGGDNWQPAHTQPLWAQRTATLTTPLAPQLVDGVWCWVGEGEVTK